MRGEGEIQRQINKAVRAPLPREISSQPANDLDYCRPFHRCTIPGRCRSTGMEVSVSSKWVMAAGYRFFMGGSWPCSGRSNAGSVT
jgi:hypothetical protein